MSQSKTSNNVNNVSETKSADSQDHNNDEDLESKNQHEENDEIKENNTDELEQQSQSNIDSSNETNKISLLSPASPASLSSNSSSNTKIMPMLLTLLSVRRYLKHHQEQLTAPPLVYRQSTPQNEDICARMGFILKRKIRPSIIGMNGILNSIAAYAYPGPSPKQHHHQSNEHPNNKNGENLFHFREIMKMGRDGAKVAIDWELPHDIYNQYLDRKKDNNNIPSPNNKNNHINNKQCNQIQQTILNGPITKPIVLILHGINNDSSFGYIQSLMRACTDRGWIAAGMNFRGCGGIPMETPRGYTAAYTNDVRSVVHQISHRLELGVSLGLMKDYQDQPAPLFLIGNSLGANILVKYLGEECFAAANMEKMKTSKQAQDAYLPLPRSIAGAISLGNPFQINSSNVPFPWGHTLGLGLKKFVLMNYAQIKQFQCKHYQTVLHDALWKAATVADIDRTFAPIMIRNEAAYPFTTQIGYSNPDGGSAYWKDSSCYTWMEHISIPILNITAKDDFLVASNAMRKMDHCLRNPNLIYIETKTGGHLGWFHHDDNNSGILGSSWADIATTEFISAVIAKREEECLWSKMNEELKSKSTVLEAKRKAMAEESKEAFLNTPIRSRL